MLSGLHFLALILLAACSTLANAYGGKCRSFIWQTGIVTTRTSAHIIMMIMALSFVPTPDVVSAFETLMESCPAEVEPVMDYWEDTYIGRSRRAAEQDLSSPSNCGMSEIV